MAARAAVVGAGISGAACARSLRAAGVTVELFDREVGSGGRMTSPVLHGRPTDLGAAYFTAKDEAFSTVVADWVERGVARAWTDTFTVLAPDGRSSTSGPVRYAAPGGLAALVQDLLPVPVLPRDVRSFEELDHDAVVLAMPDPLAEHLTGDLGRSIEWVEFEPVVAVAGGWAERHWARFDAAFVNDDPDLTLVADDGARRGDGAAVLVAHAGADLARDVADRPDDVVPAVIAALHRLLGFGASPEWTRAVRWPHAKPVTTHGDASYGMLTADSRPIGLCTDSWCPSGAPRIEAAWLSGHLLGHELASRLAR